MTRFSLYRLAGVYTVLMFGIVSFMPGVPAGAILLAVANVWFWIGRCSTMPNWRLDSDADVNSPTRWGRQ